MIATMSVLSNFCKLLPVPAVIYWFTPNFGKVFQCHVLTVTAAHMHSYLVRMRGLWQGWFGGVEGLPVLV